MAYTPETLAELTAVKRSADAKRHLIDVEIKHDTSPWWAHVAHNQRDALNPLLVGFYQEPLGRIRNIYGPRHFKSKRQIDTSGMFFGGRSEDKEVNLLTTRFEKVHVIKTMKSPLYASLPEDLSARLEQGEILVTGGDDLYRIDDFDVAALSQSIGLRAFQEFIDDRISMSTAQNESPYYLLYYSDYHSDQTGRTGVVMVKKNGTISPLIFNVDGNEFVLEIKGCGMKTGGFGRPHHRTGRDIITGGAEGEQAINEFDRLSDSSDPRAPKPVASILFGNPNNPQGYILRLTPSTVRASYTANEQYPDIEHEENVTRIIHIYAKELGEHIFGKTPKILDRSSHSENILMWGDGQSAFTDFSDHVAFSDVYFPHSESHGGYMTPKNMLNYFIEMVREIPGYKLERDRKTFVAALKRTLVASGCKISLHAEDTIESLTEKLWNAGVARQVFFERRKTGYRALGVQEEMRKDRESTYCKDKLALASEDEFINKYTEQLRDIVSMLRVFIRKTNSKSRETVEKILSSIEGGDLSVMFNNIDELYSILFGLKNISEPEKDQIFRPLSYFGTLHSAVLPLTRYLKHEFEIIDAATQTSVPEEQQILHVARCELEEKEREIAGLLPNPQKLYSTLFNSAYIEEFLKLDYYIVK